MSENRKEQISAMVDDELDSNSEHAVNDLIGSQSLKASWSRYHLIRDSLNENVPESIDMNLATRISASLQNDPTILAPRASSAHSMLKPVAGFAIAASVAAIAILGLQQQNQDPTEAQPQQIATFTPQSSMPAIKPQLAPAGAPTEAQLRLVKANTRARLNSYLVNHNEYRTNSGFQGMLPYVRTVTFENNQ